MPVTKDGAGLLDASEDVFEQAEQLRKQAEESDLFMRILAKLGLSCQDIIRNSLSGQPQEKIAELLGVTYGYLRKKKSECMASLIELIKKHKGKEQV